MKQEEVRKTVRERYGNIARQDASCCCGGAQKQVSSCCGSGTVSPVDVSKNIGYSEADLNEVPEGANLGLGCGNPVALASLKKGEVVLDLGSGAGFDCFLAASRVGKEGKVIGVDMTPDMLDKARANARKGKYPNVEFRLGEIENLPVADNTVDVIISNCVINLSIDKKRVFQEAFRVLKPGGRLMVSDIVLLGELPPGLKESVEAYVSCIAGALNKQDYLQAIQSAGFSDIRVMEETVFPIDDIISEPETMKILKKSKVTPEQAQKAAASVVSIKVSAVKAEKTF